MPKSFLLNRSSEGFNRVFEDFNFHALELTDPASAQHIKPLNEYLKKFNPANLHHLALELGQVLKVAWQEIAKVMESDGYISLYAQEELDSYLECRLTLRQINFLQRQAGDAGQNNGKSHV